MSAPATLPQIADLVRDVGLDQIDALVQAMSAEERAAVLDAWALWAMPHQRLPDGAWSQWVCLGGRGSGKTYAGARTTNEIARDRKKIRTGEIIIAGRTAEQARRDLVEGPSGILATAPSDFVPRWFPGKKLLIWPNAVRGWVISGDASEQALGINAAWAWLDEWMAWVDPQLAWSEHIRPAVRTGWARSLFTSTPKPQKCLRDLIADPGTVLTRATTYDNPWLPNFVLQNFRRVYEGTRRGREQLLAEILEDLTGALWLQHVIDEHRIGVIPPRLVRVIVSIDPAGGKDPENDETGIVVLGLDDTGHGYVLHDASGRHGATEWPNRAVALFHYYRADRIIAEKNFGGDLVELAIRAVDAKIPYTPVTATRGKVLRAEPIAALYERGLVHHVGRHEQLERQQTEWLPGPNVKSPDRVDALVHGLTHLMLDGNQTGSINAYL